MYLLQYKSYHVIGACEPAWVSDRGNRSRRCIQKVIKSFHLILFTVNNMIKHIYVWMIRSRGEMLWERSDFCFYLTEMWLHKIVTKSFKNGQFLTLESNLMKLSLWCIMLAYFLLFFLNKSVNWKSFIGRVFSFSLSISNVMACTIYHNLFIDLHFHFIVRYDKMSKV